MTRIARRHYVVLGVVAAAALAITNIGSTATAKTVKGTVGPGFTIGLTLNGKKVTKLKAGTQYRFAISDRSSSHDFHLTGPGINRVLTSVGFVGSKSYTLTLKKGSYHFQCDPHASFMNGAFKVS